MYLGIFTDIALSTRFGPAAWSSAGHLQVTKNSVLGNFIPELGLSKTIEANSRIASLIKVFASFSLVHNDVVSIHYQLLDKHTI